MAKSCNACGKYLSPAGAATCSVCSALFHKACVSLPESSPAPKGWACPGCKVRTRKDDNTPVKAATQDAPAPKPATLGIPPAHSPAAPTVNVQDVHKELAEWITEMREFRQEMAEFRASVRGLSERVDNIEERLVAIERRSDEPPAMVTDLRLRVALLQQEINDRDQDALLSDLEIGHIPEEKGENVLHTVSVLAAKLGVPLDERDIVFAERVGVAQVAGAAGAPPNPRRVVVRLARRHLRDQMLQGARVRRTLTAADAGRPAGTTAPRIFVNERLTRANRLLFHRVREEARRLQWRFVWTRRGRVYARQGDGAPAYPIRVEADLGRVFGSAQV